VSKTFLFRILIFVFLACFPFVSFPETISLEKITVEPAFFLDSYQDSEYLNPQDFVVYSPEDILGFSSDADLIQRAPFGVQQDISIRASSFEDVNINIDGLEVNDPQTGHYSLEIPLTSADIEKAQISANSQAVNFQVKKPQNKGFLLKASFGQHALWENLLSLQFPLGNFNTRFSLEHKISSGSRQDTDFQIYNISFHSLLEDESKKIEFLFGSTKKDFGADSFYSAAYPQEAEHITQQLLWLKAGPRAQRYNWENVLYYRRHYDKYVLDRHQESFYTNYHTTYIYGIKSHLNFLNGNFAEALLEEEKITSTNLGNHNRLREGFFFGFKEKRLKGFVFDFTGGLDYYKEWNALEKIHLSGGYIFENNLKALLSFDRFHRIPSFTELYYSSPANIGDPQLKSQRTDNIELGLEYSLNWVKVRAAAFTRWQRDTIDWVKDSSSSPWEARNVGDISVEGLDFSGNFFEINKFIKRAGMSYTYLNLKEKNPCSFSKYVSDYNRHKIVTNLGFAAGGFTIDTDINSNFPRLRKGYTTVDIRIQRQLGRFNISLEGLNVFNKSYEEAQDIEASGRWCKINCAYSF